MILTAQPPFAAFPASDLGRVLTQHLPVEIVLASFAVWAHVTPSGLGQPREDVVIALPSPEKSASTLGDLGHGPTGVQMVVEPTAPPDHGIG
jgi:hypothetical protein